MTQLAALHSDVRSGPLGLMEADAIPVLGASPASRLANQTSRYAPPMCGHTANRDGCAGSGSRKAQASGPQTQGTCLSPVCKSIDRTLTQCVPSNLTASNIYLQGMEFGDGVMKCPDPRNQETPVSGQCVHIAIIWHLSLRALTDCTRRCDLGFGQFSPHPEMT